MLPAVHASIDEGRRAVLGFPHSWLVEHIQSVARESLNLSDYWEFRRFLELVSLIDVELVAGIAAIGLDSSDFDIREAAEDFSNVEVPRQFAASVASLYRKS
jgi:hypothetical protein